MPMGGDMLANVKKDNKSASEAASYGAISTKWEYDELEKRKTKREWLKNHKLFFISLVLASATLLTLFTIWLVVILN